VVGALFRGGSLFECILSTTIRVDGRNATKKLVAMIHGSKFKPQIRCILLDGIALGGFNVVDIQTLHSETGIPVIVVIRRKPDINQIKKVLTKINHPSKIKLIEKAGPVKKLGKIYVQHCGIGFDEVKEIIGLTATRSYVPEPIRVCHLIASGIVDGESRGRA